MTDIDSDLQEKVIRLEKENENLQKDLENDIKTQSDLIEKNLELELKVQELERKNLQLQKDKEETDKMAMELTDDIYRLQFGETIDLIDKK